MNALARIVRTSVVALCSIGVPAHAAAQDADCDRATLELTTPSSEARAAFKAGWAEERRSRSTIQLQRALALDSTFGVARALLASRQPGLTTSERRLLADQGVRDAAAGSLGELVLAALFRESALGNRRHASMLAAAAASLLCEEPLVFADYAVLLGLTGRLDSAIVIGEHARSAFPNTPAWGPLSWLQLEAGDTLQALETAEQYANQQSNDPGALRWLGYVQLVTNQFEIARATLSHVLDIDSTFVYAYLNLADLAHWRGEGDLARDYLARAVQYEPLEAERLRIREWIVGSHLSEGNIPAARELLISLAHDAERGGHLFRGAKSLRALAVIDAAILGDSKAESILARADSLFPGGGSTQRLWVAAAYAFAGRGDAALSAITLPDRDASDQNTDLPERCLVRAILLLQQGNPAAAVAELQRADPDDPWTQAMLSWALQAAGDSSQAAALVRDRLLSVRRELFDLHWMIARALAVMGRGPNHG